MSKTTLWMTGALAALAVSGAMVSVPAQAATSINVQIGPPPPRYEVVPVVRPGYLWVPGHWEWAGNRHVWVAGHYLRERPGFYYTQPVWVQSGPHWVYHGGGWARGNGPGHGHGYGSGRRDSDRDGIPNRHDRDRDGDGVPNRYDRNPNNPHRR
jgi:hypothetical protein